MKTRLLVVLILATGLMLLLTWVVAASAAEIRADSRSDPNMISIDHEEPYGIPRHPGSLGYTPNLTFTPVSTTYLPLIQRSLSTCATAPTLISPTNGSPLNSLIAVLTYMRGTAPVSYTLIEIADNPAFNVPIEYSTSGGGLGPWQLRLFDNLQPATMYYWRVQDNCGAANSPYSAVFSFTTGSGGVILPSPVLASPLSGTLGLGQQVTLTWNSVAGAVGYRVKRGQPGSGGGILYFTPANSQVIRYLQPNTTYEWYVTAYNSYAYGNQSDKWRFGTGSFLVLQEVVPNSPTGETFYYFPNDRPWHTTELRR
jgi:hypothetical protein